MNCPSCGESKTSVEQTIRAGADVVRMRLCSNCGSVFMTEERLVEGSVVAGGKEG